MRFGVNETFTQELKKLEELVVVIGCIRARRIAQAAEEMVEPTTVGSVVELEGITTAWAVLRQYHGTDGMVTVRGGIVISSRIWYHIKASLMIGWCDCWLQSTAQVLAWWPCGAGPLLFYGHSLGCTGYILVWPLCATAMLI
jgi:hypothetical protein